MFRPPPDVLADIVEDEHQGQETDEDGEEATAFGLCLVGRRDFWERVELFEWRYRVELLE